jgi:glutathione S-transferase
VIKLYGIPASRASRSLWMLEELGVAYENVPTNFIGDAQKPDYLKINPNGKIPALVDDDGTVIWESLAINLYLAMKYGKGSFWPAGLADQGRAIQWSLWAMTTVEPPLMQVLMNRAFLPEGQRDAAQAEEGVRALEKPLAVLDGALAGRDTLLGGGFSVADLNVASVLTWAPTLGKIDLSPWPRTKAWLEAASKRPALGRVFKRR